MYGLNVYTSFMWFSPKPQILFIVDIDLFYFILITTLVCRSYYSYSYIIHDSAIFCFISVINSIACFSCFVAAVIVVIICACQLLLASSFTGCLLSLPGMDYPWCLTVPINTHRAAADRRVPAVRRREQDKRISLTNSRARDFCCVEVSSLFTDGELVCVVFMQ